MKTRKCAEWGRLALSDSHAPAAELMEQLGLGQKLRSLLDSVRQAVQQLSETTGRLNHGMTELDPFDFDGREFLQEGLLQAVASLTGGLSALVQLSTFDLPRGAAGQLAQLKAAVDREGDEALTKTLDALERKENR